MKKTPALILFLAVLLSLASCGLIPGKASPSPSQEPPSSGAPSASPAASPSEAASPAPDTSEVEVFLAAEPTAGEVGAYLKQNAQELPQSVGQRLYALQ